MERAPFELLEETALSLDPSSLLNLCRTDRRMAAICSDDLFWQRKLKRDYPTAYERWPGRAADRPVDFYVRQYENEWELEQFDTSILELALKRREENEALQRPAHRWHGPQLAIDEYLLHPRSKDDLDMGKRLSAQLLEELAFEDNLLGVRYLTERLTATKPTDPNFPRRLFRAATRDRPSAALLKYILTHYEPRLGGITKMETLPCDRELMQMLIDRGAQLRVLFYPTARRCPWPVVEPVLAAMDRIDLEWALKMLEQPEVFGFEKPRDLAMLIQLARNRGLQSGLEVP